MKLPFAEQAVVPETKLTQYLLNREHPQGGSKARFFLGLGFEREQPELLGQELVRSTLTSNMTETIFEFGRKYAGIGMVRSPHDRWVRVWTVWVLRNGLPPPILVTAYPAEKELS